MKGQGGRKMKRKIILTIAMIICLFTFTWSWFGNARGVQEIQGTIMLHNPIAITCIILVFVGIWTDFGDNSEILGMIGLLGIIAMAIYEFMTWHIITITGQFDINYSIQMCYPEFYYALLCFVFTSFLYRYTYKKYNRTQEFHMYSV